MQWSVTEQTAQLTWSGWTWRWNMAQPSAGIAVLGQADTPWQLLAIHPAPGHACHIEDWFARGSDLMVRYGQSTSDTFAFQVDFRAVPDDQLETCQCGFDVWLSVQTQLLDSHPVLEVSNQVFDSPWQASDDHGAAIEKGAVASWTCRSESGFVAVLIHPSDQPQSALVSHAGQPRLRLFGNFMEKGVIRRGRLRLLVSSQPVSQQRLSEAYSAFAHSPLPLTT